MTSMLKEVLCPRCLFYFLSFSNLFTESTRQSLSQNNASGPRDQGSRGELDVRAVAPGIHGARAGGFGGARGFGRRHGAAAIRDADGGADQLRQHAASGEQLPGLFAIDWCVGKREQSSELGSHNDEKSSENMYEYVELSKGARHRYIFMD